MRRLLSALALSAAVLPSFQAQAQAQQPRELRLISDRTDQGVLRPMLDAFEARANAKVTAVFMDQGLVNRLESRPTEADIVITKDAELLEIAANKGLLQPFVSKAIEQGIPAAFRDPQNRYFVDAYRARVIFYSKARVKPSDLSSYEDLGSAKWKGRVCIRSGSHDYNLALFGQFLRQRMGEAKAKCADLGASPPTWRVRRKRQRPRTGASAIFEGKCDIALMNTYYHYLHGRPTQSKSPGPTPVSVFFPEPGRQGHLHHAVRRAGITQGHGKPRPGAGSCWNSWHPVEGQQLMVTRDASNTRCCPTLPAHPLMAQARCR